MQYARLCFFRVVTTGILSALLLFSGCGDDSDDKDKKATGSTEQTATAAAEIKIQKFAFIPATLEAKVGDTIKVTNLDSTEHTATAEDNSFDTGLLTPNASATITLSKAGVFPFVCTFHASTMKGTITVK